MAQILRKTSFCSLSAPARHCCPVRCCLPAKATRSSNRTSAVHTKYSRTSKTLDVLAVGAVLGACMAAGPALAFDIQVEPANALSLPTWAIHVSSVVEWVLAMSLFWKYAEVSGNERWKGMTWGMMPCLGSAMAACTWHFFYNSPDLEFLVALQAFLTVVGNCTCWIAAYRIYQGAQEAAS